MIGTKLAHYEITSHLGSGGMGDVYQATDRKLGRCVAIKLLPEVFTHDAERAARFEREAHVLASLNHPHIAAIYGIEEANQRKFLVMELVAGETLAQRIARGPIPLDETLAIAAQIAEGLEAAHDKAVIHRDLKPANIKITPDGNVKVLDFGLAKAFEEKAAVQNLSDSPTMMSIARTNAGMILGTAAYMSPEQAKGQYVDRRTDIFAFGAVLYEMLTAKQAFAGETVSDILSRVILAEPDWTRLPNATPAAVRHLLKRCLQKDRNLRLRDAGDARLEILEPRGEVAAPEANGRERIAWIAFAAALLAAVVLAIPAVRHLRETRPSEMRVEINTPATNAAAADLISFALSPDGQQIVFVASGDGAPRLWLRSMGSAVVQPLTGTEGAAYPFWSPNNNSIGFFADGKLKRFDIGGGPPQTVATGVNVNLPRGGTWNADGIILFVPGPSSPLWRVPASGGQAVPMNKPDGHLGHAFPYFLPDGRQFLFHARGTPETEGIYLGSLDSDESQRLTPADTAGIYVSPGWLLWVREGALVGQHLDLNRKVLTGDPMTLADSMTFDPVNKVGAISASMSGVVAYRTGGANRRQLTWFDRSGKELGTLGALDENALSSPRVSLDGSRVAVTRTVQGNTDIWLMDATGTRMTRFTFNAATERNPIWSPDGNWIVFESDRNGHRDLYQKPSNGVGAEELLVESTIANVASDWSKDSRFILYYFPTTLGDRDLWVLPMNGVHKPWLLLKTGFDERWATLSPNGRWAAYISNESGPNEIYIRPFTEQAAAGAGADPGAGQWQVSTAGGMYPRWRPDGNELFFVGSNGEMMAVPITATGTTLTPGTPVVLFPMKIFGGGGRITSQTLEYDVTRDGRFLINTVPDDASPITLLQNWSPEPKK